MGIHPDREEFAAFIDQPDADKFSELRLHIIQCSACREKVNSMSRVVHGMVEAVKQSTEDKVDLPDELLDLLDGNDRLDNQESIQDYLTIHPEFTKSALDYFHNSKKMGLDFLASNNEKKLHSQQTSEKSTTNKFTEFFSKLFCYQIPAWINVPVVATAVVVISVILLPNENGSKLVAYQDSSYLEFSQSQRPGIGFFADAEKEKIVYDRVNVKLDNDQNIKLSWPEIKNVVQYNVSVSIIEETVKNNIFNKTTSETQITISKNLLVNNRRAEWKIYGATTDGKNFTTSGGFVIQN